MDNHHLGFAGKIARAFIDSKLTPLIVIASLLLGVYAVLVTPREEEPQIVVPMVDIYLPMPGSTPQEVEERVVSPIERKMWELNGVEYVYAMSRPGMGLVTVRFLVGENMEDSLVKLYNKLMSNRGLLPPAPANRSWCPSPSTTCRSFLSPSGPSATTGSCSAA